MEQWEAAMRKGLLVGAMLLGFVSPSYAGSDEKCAPGETLVFYNAGAKTAIKERMTGPSELLVYHKGKEHSFPLGSKGSGISAKIVLFSDDDMRALHFVETIDGHDIILLGDEAYWEACMNENTLEVTGYTSWEVEASAL